MFQMLIATTSQNFKQSLLILLIGMAGVFVFMGLLFGLIVALEKLLPRVEKQSPDEDKK
ncbi:MAG: OadG family protein [Candidatus Cloacimonetes bacterium]|nr:OadG family protein [Candidatus Cloacimonadota bacterium]